MTLENKLQIKNSAELALVEEKFSKTSAIELYESDLLKTFQIAAM